MKKLKLNLDEIKVESFETVKSSNEKGTVHGYDYTNGTEYSCISNCCTEFPTAPCYVCQYPTVSPNLTCDGSPGCGPSEFTCGGNTCAASCMSCPGGIC